MAQKVQVILTCDLDDDDTPAVETVNFSYDGASYEFELCEAHLSEFRKVMDGYASAARRGGRATSRARRPGGRPEGNPSEIATIREWARQHGHAVSDRGRIPAEVRAAYEAAQR